MLRATQNSVSEWSLASSRTYDDPFNELEVDFVITDPDGIERRVPAFWSGDQIWRVRYAASRPGRHCWRSVCSDASDPDLHGREGIIDVSPYTGNSPLLRLGPLGVSDCGRYLQHHDGTPFFWLADTWWMALCERLAWPADFQQLTQDRVDKGFTVIQLVAGLFPDMPAFDERSRNEAGFSWEEDFTRINPSYYDHADVRIHHLVRNGLVPCILGCWGYYLPWLGVVKMKRHWRYLVARYGAYPVVWCLAGEGSMPWYLSEQKDADRAWQQQGWTEVARYLRQIDPYGHPVTIHPSSSSRNTVDDPTVLDFDMLQTGHGDRRNIPNTIRQVQEAYAIQPVLPVINSEVCYEGIGEACRQEVQRFMFWACVLSGACGHTYGANGIWQVNLKDLPFGPSPHGTAWGNTPWDEASQLPGSRQLGLARAFLEKYEWWRFEPHPEWVDPAATAEQPNAAFAAGIPGQTRVLFLPSGVWDIIVKGIEPGSSYRASLFNPVNGDLRDIGIVETDAQGDWRNPVSRAPVFQDWVVVLDTT